jgi:uncharacterized phage protein (TIGR01671 family)
MREIKFRAWDKGRMIEPMGLLMRDAPQWLDKLSSEAILMQFTGLHDKNGKEIWEGDIVKFETLDAINNQTLVGAIKYSEHGTRFGVEIEHRGLLQFYPNYTEVIGNIYENPELIEVSP